MSPSTRWEIRPLADFAEMRRAVDFQRVVWGSNFSEVVPAAVFWFARRIGGITLGAFDTQGEMIGLLFGMTGWSGGRPVHWSDLLAVHPAARGLGLGIELKRRQREILLERGVTLVSWTFDPLESRNAWINFSRLGITAREYIRDCYGVSSSPLHRGIGTDRLVAIWQLDSARVRTRVEERASLPGAAELPCINPSHGPLELDLHVPRVRLRIPASIQAVKERDELAARRWRDQTRTSFEAYFARGYEAVEIVRDDEETSSYVLERVTAQ